MNGLTKLAMPLDVSAVVDESASATYVLIGEASHGTREFYETRAEITKRLITEHGFCAVAVEADWPDADRVNRYVRGRGADATAERALGSFTRFPVWMWRNQTVEAFVEWLRGHNSSRRQGDPEVGFYGLDLYSMNTSRYEVVRFLEKVDPEAARRARSRYGCFDHYGEDEQAYGYAAGFDLSRSCEDAAVEQLIDLRRRAWDYAHRDGQIAEDNFFSAEQNARLIRNAEEYYRKMFSGRVSTWNLRDRHMAETLHALSAHLEGRYRAAKIVVWAHNSHLGDARETSMGKQGEWNLGQLARERYGEDAVRLIGFTTYAGTVRAADNWGDLDEEKRVTPALPGSWESLLHDTGKPAFFLAARNIDVQETRLERAIGVIYRPQTERVSHYFEAKLGRQFDAVIHIDQTTAVEPLPRVEDRHPNEVPETFPSGV